MGRSEIPGYDGSAALCSAKQERFAQACLTMSLSDAYREAYDCSRMAGPSINSKACTLRADGNVTVRIEWLQKQTQTALVMTVTQRKELLTRAILDAAEGLKPYLKALPDGEMSLNVNEGNLTQAMESIEQHIRLGGEGGGPDTVIRKAKIRDFLGYMAELNKLDGSYPAQKVELQGGPKVIIMDLPMPPGPRPRKRRLA